MNIRMRRKEIWTSPINKGINHHAEASVQNTMQPVKYHNALLSRQPSESESATRVRSRSAAIAEPQIRATTLKANNFPAPSLRLYFSARNLNVNFSQLIYVLDILNKKYIYVIYMYVFVVKL